MKEEVLATVLDDILKELAESNDSLKSLQSAMQSTQEKVAAFEQKLNDQQVIAPPADTRAINDITRAAAYNIRKDLSGQLTAFRKENSNSNALIAELIEAQPKNVIQQKRYGLFSDSESNNYKYVVRWAFRSLIAALSLGVLLSLGGRYIDKSQTIQSDEEELRKNILDTLYKKYMHKNEAGLYEFNRDSGRAAEINGKKSGKKRPLH
jgi:hypothetical protein